jgi:HAD superfamily hydrolase (TIGR01509 family)
MPKAFIFDIDGVLVDSEYQNYISLRDSLKEVLGIDFTFEEDIELGPIPTYKKLEYIKRYHSISLDKKQFDLLMRSKFELLIANFDRSKTNQEAQKIFQFLKTKDVKLALVSNARSQYIQFIIDLLGINGLVDLFVSNDQHLKPKPSPEMYNFAMLKLGVEPKETLIFEDSDIGLEAAYESKAKVFEVRSFSQLTLELIERLYAEDSY